MGIKDISPLKRAIIANLRAGNRVGAILINSRTAREWNIEEGDVAHNNVPIVISEIKDSFKIIGPDVYEALIGRITKKLSINEKVVAKAVESKVEEIHKKVISSDAGED